VTPRIADADGLERLDFRARRFRWWWLVLLPAGLVFVVALSRLVDTSPSTVHRVSVVNNSGYDVFVTVSDASGNAMDLGTVRAHSTSDFLDVIDQGRAWAFHFIGQTHDGGQVPVSRVDLAAAGWRVVMPDSVARRIAASDYVVDATTAQPQ
jgi:hypothetical protein